MNTINNLKDDTKLEIAPLEKAVQVCGGQGRLGELCKVKQQSISKWLKYGLPAERVLAVESATNGVVTRYELRPDLYPRD